MAPKPSACERSRWRPGSSDQAICITHRSSRTVALHPQRSFPRSLSLMSADQCEDGALPGKQRRRACLHGAASNASLLLAFFARDGDEWRRRPNDLIAAALRAMGLGDRVLGHGFDPLEGRFTLATTIGVCRHPPFLLLGSLAIGSCLVQASIHLDASQPCRNARI